MNLVCRCDFMTETLMVSHHSEDIMILVCHVIFQDHVFKRLFDFIAWEPLIPHPSNQPAKFDGHGYCGSGDIMVLVCHVILPVVGNRGTQDTSQKSQGKLFLSFLYALF